MVQGMKNFGMKTIVEDWGTEKDKFLYADAHKAIVDAEVLGSLCTGKLLAERFLNWQYLCKEASGPVVKCAATAAFNNFHEI